MIKRLLIITRHRLNENNGGSNGSKGFVHCFAHLFDDCSIIFPEFENPTSYIPDKYKLFPCHDKRSKIRKGIDCYRGVLSPLSSFAKEHLAKHRYDIVVVDHSFIATTSLLQAIKSSGAKLITIHHNVERDYQHDNRKDYSILFRLPYLHFAKKAECDCLQYSDINLTVTEKDASVFRSWYPNANIYTWGNYEYRTIPTKNFTQKENTKTFIITGSLCFIQSLLPILDFINRYWPIIKEKCPNAKLIIAGRNPDKLLYDKSSNEQNITLVPNPEDISAVVQQANYYICPIFSGSGRKLRVMDGLKQGIPVLCHDVSVSGYENMVSAHCLFAYHDENTFEIALEQMLSAAPLPNMVYQTYQKNFSTEAGIRRLSLILEQNSLL